MALSKLFEIFCDSGSYMEKNGAEILTSQRQPTNRYERFCKGPCEVPGTFLVLYKHDFLLSHMVQEQLCLENIRNTQLFLQSVLFLSGDKGGGEWNS